MTAIIDFLTPEGAAASLANEQPAVVATGYWSGVGTLRDWADDSAIPVEVSSFLISDQKTGEPTALATVQHDISERLSSRRALEHLRFHDQLTGLADRVLFVDRYQQAERRSQLTNSHLGVLYIDVDNFKAVNAGLGHGVGDQVLTEIANRINSIIGTTDSVARFGAMNFLFWSPTHPTT